MPDSRPANESAPNVVIASTIMPRAPLPLRGFIKAVGMPSTQRVSNPRAATAVFSPSTRKSSVPDARNMPTATRMATR